MPTTTLYATSLESGAVSDAANALGASDNIFTTSPAATTWNARFIMQSAPGQLDGTQQIVVRVRGSGEATLPFIIVRVYTDNGAVVVASLVKEQLSFSAPSNIPLNFTSTYNGPLWVEVDGSTGGGSPSKKAALQLDSITHTANYIEPSTPPAVAYDLVWTGAGWVAATVGDYGWSGTAWLN